MNRFFLIIGSLLLLGLSAALVAPRFIDWSNYTDIIEEQASRLLGRDVHVSGAVDLRLLPMPRLTFSDVQIASRIDGSQPEVRVERIEALMSLAPFLRGQAELVELRLDRPIILLSALDGSARSDEAQGLDLGSIRIEEAVISNGRVERLASNGSVRVLVDELNARMSAPSLLGPWRVDPASALIEGERVSLRVQSGAYGGDQRMRLRIDVLPAARALEVSLDGFLDWSGEDALLEGRAVARSLSLGQPVSANAGSLPLNWRVAGDIEASLGELEAQNIELTLGQGEDQAFALNGHARLALGARAAFNAALSSRQVDLDRMLGGGAAAPVDVATGWQAVNDLMVWIEQTTVPGEVTFDIPAIVLGGSVIRDIGFDATYQPGLPISLENLEATFPGDAALAFTGAVGLAERGGLALDGIISLESSAPDLLVAWSTGRREDGGTFSQLSSLALSGRIVADPQGLALERLRGTIDDAALEGSLRYEAAHEEGAGGRLSLMLDAGRFDFGLLAGLGDWLSAGAGGAVALDSVDAQLAIGELVAGLENLGEVSVAMTATPARVRVDRLTVGNAAGARLSASGYLDRGAFPPLGVFSLDGELESIAGVVRLARDVLGDHRLLVDLERNGGLYEPAILNGTYSHDPSGGLQLGLNGSLAGTRVDLSASMPPVHGMEALPMGLGSLFTRPASLQFSANSADAFALIGQLGLPVLPIDLQGEGSFSVYLSSDGVEAPIVRAGFDGLDMALRMDGRLLGDGGAGPSGIEGTGSVLLADLGQAGLMAGMALPGLFEPIAASARFGFSHDSAGRSVALSSIEGLVDGVVVTGTASVERTALADRLSADLQAESLDLGVLMSSFIGPGALDQGFSIGWPEGPIAFNPLPLDLRLQISTPRMQIWDGLGAQNARLDLQASDGELVLDEIVGSVLGGDMSGRLALRDADRGTLASGRLLLRDIDLSSVSWERAGQPVIAGLGSLNLAFESSGGSMASLMAGLTGDGTLALQDAALSGVGLSGFARILQASDAGLLGEEDDLEAAFGDALGVGTMAIAQADTPVSLVGGVMRASNVYLEGDDTALRGGWTLDLATQDLDADFSLAAVSGPGDVEAMPNVGLSFTGPLAAPQLQLDVAQIASFLSVRQLEGEIRRVEALNAEIVERERLLRTMAADGLDRARLERVAVQAQEAEDAAALAAEAQRLAAQAEADAQAEAQALAEAEREAAAPLELPPLEAPITVESNPVREVNPLTLGENPPPATSAPLDLRPLNLAPVPTN